MATDNVSRTCPECDGRGEYLDAPQNVLDGRPYWVKCEVCGGTGKRPITDLNSKEPPAHS